jgi:hypothetical protein
MNRSIWVAAAAALLASGPVLAQTKAKAGQAVGRYQLITIKDQDGKELLVRMDKESGATWVLRYGEYPPSPKGPVHYWLTVPCARGDNLTACK